MARFVEPPHRHSAACFELRLGCGATEHGHGAACYDVTGATGRRPVLTCSRREHAHSSGCYRRQLTCGNP